MASPKIPTGVSKGQGASTAWKKGQSGNPAGRPKGIKERIPRGYVRAMVIDTIERRRPGVIAALERAATNPKTVVSVLDHAAKLNREVGHQADGRSGETHFHIHTNVDIMALRAAAHRAVPVAPAAAPALVAPRRRRYGKNQPSSTLDG